MHFLEALRISLQSLWANKLRSVLTLLGVVIGVAAVIAVVTFVNGINGYVAEKIFNLGADVFIMFKVSPAVTNVDHYLEGQKRKDLTMDDYRAVRDGCKHCAYVGAYARNNSGHVKYNEQALTDTMVQGMTPSVATTQDIDMDSGRMLEQIDLENNAPVAVVGTDIPETLMPGVDPIGKEIRVDGWTYRIIGVGKKKGKTLGQSLDNYVLIPMTSWLKQYGSYNTNMRISAKAAGTGAHSGHGQGRGAGHPARAAACGSGGSGQFRRRDQQQSTEHLVEPDRDVLHRDDWDCRDFHGGGRHRHHEHHAGVGHRTHARSGDSQGDGRAALRCDAAIPD